MKIIYSVVLTLILVGFVQGAEVKLDGADVAVLACALKQFAVDQPKADLKNFTVRLQGTRQQAEVAFVPHEQTPATSRWLEFGGNDFGKEIHYVISRRPVKVLAAYPGK